MDIETVVLIIATVLSVIGFIGGVPQILQWSRPKPHLVLVSAELKPLKTETTKPDDRYRLHIIVNNDNLIMRRGADASNVKVEFYVFNGKNEQCGSIQTYEISKILPNGEGADKDFVFRPEGEPLYNPHRLVFRITCDNGNTIKRAIWFEI